MRFKAFTLAELLIALLILGVIATFTIPKVLIASQKSQYNSIGKEAAGTVANAFQQYQFEGNVLSSGTKPASLTPYLNYVQIITAGNMDSTYGNTTRACADITPCMKLHNGAVLFPVDFSYGGTNITNAITMYIDPDGKPDVITNGPAKSLLIYIYYNGRIASRGTVSNNTCNNSFCVNPAPSEDPPWFSWN